jgi:hypothetical protein
VGVDRLRQARGLLSDEEAYSREQLFEYTRKECQHALVKLPAEMTKKADIAKIIKLLVDAIVKSRIFYRQASAPYKKTITAVKAAAAKLKSNAMLRNLQSRLNRIRSGGGSSHSRSRSGGSSNARKTRRALGRRGGATRRALRVNY